jgi:hypothetical protein
MDGVARALDASTNERTNRAAIDDDGRRVSIVTHKLRDATKNTEKRLPLSLVSRDVGRRRRRRRPRDVV